MAPHKVHGTHVFIYNKYNNALFEKKREKPFKIMEESNSGMHGHRMPIESTKTETKHKRLKGCKDSTQYRVSRTDKVFALVKDENGKIIITLGGYAISQKRFDTYEQAERYLSTKPYEIIINIAALIINKKETYAKETQNATENKENV